MLIGTLLLSLTKVSHTQTPSRSSLSVIDKFLGSVTFSEVIKLNQFYHGHSDTQLHPCSVFSSALTDSPPVITGRHYHCAKQFLVILEPLEPPVTCRECLLPAPDPWPLCGSSSNVMLSFVLSLVNIKSCWSWAWCHKWLGISHKSDLIMAPSDKEQGPKFTNTLKLHLKTPLNLQFT